MPDIRLAIAGRQFTVTCQPGEEQHLARLGTMLDTAARKAAPNATSLTETRALLFAGLVLADELSETIDARANAPASEAVQSTPAPQQGELMVTDNYDDLAARAIERLTERLENLATALEKGPHPA